MTMDLMSRVQQQGHPRYKDSAIDRKPLANNSKTWAKPTAMAISCFVLAENRKRREISTDKSAPISSVKRND
jgi:hypothetical protein